MRYLLLLLTFTIQVLSSDGIYLHSNWGYMHSLNSVMAVNSTDGDIVHKARWKSKAFEDSPYYTIRIDDWRGNKVRGIEWIHHKIYLANNPAGITDFSISDGYNLLMFNLGNRSNGIIRRWGAGLIFAHVDMTLQGRDRFWNDGGISGAYLSGLAIQHAIETWVYETSHHVVAIEGKLTAAYARIPISSNDSEYADVPNVAFHLTFGIGSKPIKKGAKPLDIAQYVGAPLLHHYAIYQF